MIRRITKKITERINRPAILVIDRYEGDALGRILVIEFKDQDSFIFESVMDVLKNHSNFEILHPKVETVVTIPGLEIYTERRKIYSDRCEIDLTTKEYDLFYLLVVNRGQVLTYEQIYQSVWGDEAIGRENNAVKCHIRNLREKLFKAMPDAAFAIRCVREVGYCFEVASE